MEVKVSVVIPVYNAGPYIAQCIESLLNQTLQSCQFIFVNDGSLDDSAVTIDKYRKSDERVVLIEQKNQGVSAARNRGMDAATGEYIGFVDADDCIEEDMFERLYTAAKHSGADAAISNIEAEMDGKQVITKYPFPSNKKLGRDFIETELLPYFLKSDNLNAVWNKIYKTRIIKDNHIQFPDNIALGEDGIFNIRFFSIAHSFQYLDYAGYHYREVSGSATRNIIDKDYFKQALQVFAREFPENQLGGVLQKHKIEALKSIKLIHNVMAYIHLYLRPSNDLSFVSRYRYVRHMVGHRMVRNALPVFYRETYPSLGRYEKVLLHLIRGRSVIGLYCITAYSRLRTKSYWRNGL